MAGWDETSVDTLLADPITRDLMAADGVEPAELRALLYRVQRTIERFATKRGGPTSLASFAKLYSATPKADPARPTLPANRRRPADHSKLSMEPLGSAFRGEIRCTARS